MYNRMKHPAQFLQLKFHPSSHQIPIIPCYTKLKIKVERKYYE